MIKYYYGISVKHFIYQSKTSGNHVLAASGFSYLPKGKDPWAPADGECGLVGEIRTRMIVVAVRCITFLPPRDVQHAAWPQQLYMVWCLEGA